MSQENKGLVNLLYVNFVLNISIPHEKKLRFSAPSMHVPEYCMSLFDTVVAVVRFA